MLCIIVALHPLLRRVFENGYKPASTVVSGQKANHEKSNTETKYSPPDQRLNQRITFDVVFGLVFLSALHGFSAMKVLVILYINFSIATKLETKYVPSATWVFNIGILFANELGQGYPYSAIANLVAPGSQSDKDSSWGAILDSYGGLLPRWEVLFNVTVLRLVSFNMDRYWSLSRVGGSPIEVCTLS